MESAAVDATLERVVTHLVARLDPVALWLFGSRAEGRARPRSDYDVVVVLPDGTPDEDLDPVRAWRRVRDFDLPLDVVPCTVAEFEEERHEPGSLAHRVARRGRKIYERRA